jgi:hypothetical protein
MLLPLFEEADSPACSEVVGGDSKPAEMVWLRTDPKGQRHIPSALPLSAIPFFKGVSYGMKNMKRGLMLYLA